MESFIAIQPSVLLAPYVKQYWFLKVDNTPQNTQRLMPVGRMALTFYRSERTYSSAHNDLLPRSYISGQTSVYSNLAFSGMLDIVSVVFQPIGAMAFFEMPLYELNNRNISVDELDDPQLVELKNRLNETSCNEVCVRLIEQFLLKRLHLSDNCNQKRLSAVVGNINRGCTDIGELAQTACLGYKQFKRIFAANIGMNPKDFLQIARFQRVLNLLQSCPQSTLEKLADDGSYYDKSHLIRDFKNFSGYTPSEFLSVCEPYTHYLSLFRSAFVDIKH